MFSNTDDNIAFAIGIFIYYHRLRKMLVWYGDEILNQKIIRVT